MANEIVIQEATAELAHTAVHEIVLLATALGRYIREADASGEIAPLSRGMLDRVIRLAEAVDECLGYFGDRDAASIEHVVQCQR